MIDFDDFDEFRTDRVWYQIFFGFGPGKGNVWFDFSIHCGGTL